MNARTHITAETALPGDGPAWARSIMVRQLEVLGELAEAGLRMALAIEGQATAGRTTEAPPPLDNLAMAYARAARAVRMTVLLQSRVIKDIQALDAGAALDEIAGQTRGERRKARVERIVEQVAEAACPGDDDAVDRLMTEAGERLDDDDAYGDLLSRPVGEIVARLCRDLGLDPDWTRLAEEAWALEEEAAEAAATRTRSRHGAAPPSQDEDRNWLAGDGPIRVVWASSPDPAPSDARPSGQTRGP